MGGIRFDGVTKRYGDGYTAVEQLDLEIADGELFVLVGPSGCGKSTALRMIAGLEEVTSGELSIGGRVVNDVAPRDRDIAMVFQNYALYPHMTVRRNMGFALRLKRVPEAEREARVQEAAELLDLEAHLDRKPGQLSGGQRQRVAMGRAIVREPAAFLMDEPLSNLDAKLRVEMRAAVGRVQQRLRTTMVYVTHDQVEAMTLGDRVGVMRRGVLQQVAPPQELYARPANLFVAGFVGSPAMNFVQGRVEGGALATPLGTLPLPPGAPPLEEGRAVVAGIRPEAFEDRALVEGDASRGVELEVDAELFESVGAEAYVHFHAGGERLQLDELKELDEEAGLGDVPGATGAVVARVGGASAIRGGTRARLWLDARATQLFDPVGGEALRQA